MENKNKGLVVAVIVLAICVLGLTGYIVYDKVFKTDEPANQPVENNNNTPSINVNELGKELFNKISIQDDYYSVYVSNEALEYVLLSADDLNYDRLSNEVKLYLAYNNFTNGNVVSKIEYNSFVEAYKNLFGADKTVNFTSFENDCNSCTLENDYVTCVEQLGCGNEWESITKITLNNAKLVNDDIVLSIAKTIYDQDGNQAKVVYHYDVTFKKDSTNNWYWYSTKLAQ